MILSIFILALIGFCIALYDYIVEQKIKKTPDYKPACDLSDRISCSKPIKSEYGNLFLISNALVGMLFYALIAVLAWFNASMLLLITAIAGCLFSVFLAYILFFKIKSLCLVCISLYFINVLILANAILLIASEDKGVEIYVVFKTSL